MRMRRVVVLNFRLFVGIAGILIFEFRMVMHGLRGGGWFVHGGSPLGGAETM